MIPTLFNLLAGVAVAIGLGGIGWGVISNHAAAFPLGARLAQGGMVLSALCLLLKAFLGGGTDGFLYGPILLAFGAALTAIRPARQAGPAERADR